MSHTVHLDEIPYHADSCELFQHLRQLPGAVLLDSSYPYSRAGRYDILSALPRATLREPPASADETASRHYFDQLAAFHHEQFADIKPVSQDIPFCGGLLGSLSYDAGNGLQGVAHNAPEAAFAGEIGAYDWCAIQDHVLNRAVLVTQPGVSPTRRRELRGLLTQTTVAADGEFALLAEFKPNIDRCDYGAAFAAILDYILKGDCYQVNLAQRFSAPFCGDPWSAYRQLRAVAAAPYSAYLAPPEGGSGDGVVMSLSPERFLNLHGRRVEAAPIKGTRPRCADPVADRAAGSALCASAKDRAENLMIVDLLRNDLGRSCVPGSIHVDRLFELQSFATVHHLVSSISGELAPERDVFDLLRDSFPGGSITGAPKRRAMEIIAELEPQRRQLYCGSVLYISADGRMDSNIAIRSLLSENGELHCWAGGGIVADSDPDAEYQETFDKVGQFLKLLNDTVSNPI